MNEGSSLALPDRVSRNQWALRWRHLRTGLVIGLLCGAGVLMAWVFPLYWHHRLADKIVRVVVLDWRDFGLDTAEQRLSFELARTGLTKVLQSEDCTFFKSERGWTVECAWVAQISLPWTDVRVPLQFVSSGEAFREPEDRGE